MIEYYCTEAGRLLEMDHWVQGGWVHLTNPTDPEIAFIVRELNLEEDFVRAALDEEEASRVESENKQTLIIVDIPTVEAEGTSFVYNTIPLGIIVCESVLVTVCLKESNILEDFIEQRIRNVSTKKRTRFVLQMLHRIAYKYLQFLRQIDKASTHIENQLHKSMKNRELIQMLKLEKSLVFFSTSLTGNEVVLERLLRLDYLEKYPEDSDLLEDVIIENKQAMEMCSIHRDILSGTMDAFASVISNNLNIVMKLLAVITIILDVPMLIASLWGMNVLVPFERAPLGFYIVTGFALLSAAAIAYVLWRKKIL